MLGADVFGVFGVAYTTPRPLGDAEQRLLLARAQRAALAIQKAQLFEQAPDQ
jgi:GAF domain-containing protein